MVKENTAVSICSTPDQVQETVTDLENFGFDVKRISIIGKVYREQKEIAAFTVMIVRSNAGANRVTSGTGYAAGSGIGRCSAVRAPVCSW
ncbi:MAG: hypothetical protein P8Z37_02280 [Acidobacteriota bacterium]